MDLTILLKDLEDMYCRIEGAKNLLLDGKQVQSYNKLQGITTKCVSIMGRIRNELVAKDNQEGSSVVLIRESNNGNG